MAASKLRTFRSTEDGRWEAASARAEREGTSVSAVLNAALEAYAAAPAQSQAAPPSGSGDTAA